MDPEPNLYNCPPSFLVNQLENWIGEIVPMSLISDGESKLVGAQWWSENDDLLKAFVLTDSSHKF